jgi:hypothetical protein
MLFGPLSADYCNLFFVFMTIGLLFIVTNIIGLFYATNNKKLFPLFVSNLIMAVFTYFTHRILYSMCLSSLQ